MFFIVLIYLILHVCMFARLHVLNINLFKLVINLNIFSFIS